MFNFKQGEAAASALRYDVSRGTARAPRPPPGTKLVRSTFDSAWAPVHEHSFARRVECLARRRSASERVPKPGGGYLKPSVVTN